MTSLLSPKELRQLLLGRRRHSALPETRRDYIQDKYVIIAPPRHKRPHNVSVPAAAASSKSCVFCPRVVNKRRDILLAHPAKSDWKIAVVPNKYPAVSVKYPRAYGVQEVVIETPEPRKQLEELPVPHAADILGVYAERTRAISKNKKIEYILIFKNSGGRAGASLQHSHSQIFATALVPPHLADKTQQMRRFTRSFGSCVYCEVLEIESKGPRLVYRDDLVVAFTPYASMHNYEVWILPLRHIDNITELTPAERLAWARVQKLLLRSLSDLGLPYNYYFHQMVRDRDQHLYMKITPRGSIWAGVEIGSGVILNPVSPEEAARYYRTRLDVRK